jgi:Predicted membrane protein
MSSGKILIALTIVLLGVYWLLDSLQIISPGIMSAFVTVLPFIVLLLGVLFFISPVRRGKKPGFFWGFFFLIYGGLLLANRYDMVAFQWQDVWKLWPYLIIYFGLDMLFGNHVFITVTGDVKHGKRKKKISHEDFIRDDGDEQDAANHGTSYTFVNDSTFKSENWMVRPMNEHVRIADYKFDFTKAFIPEETIPIRLSGWVGDIKILVPDDLAYRVAVRAKVGDTKIGNKKWDGILRNISYQTENYDEAVRRLDFDFDFQVIDVSIDQV